MTHNEFRGSPGYSCAPLASSDWCSGAFWPSADIPAGLFGVTGNDILTPLALCAPPLKVSSWCTFTQHIGPSKMYSANPWPAVTSMVNEGLASAIRVHVGLYVLSGPALIRTHVVPSSRNSESSVA